MNVGRDIEKARRAFDIQNPALSKEAHSAVQCQASKEAGHLGLDSTFRKCAIYSGFEGVVVSTTLLVILSACDLPQSSILSMASVLAAVLALATGLRDWIRYRADWTHYEREKQREKWELSNYPEGERKEMIELYVQTHRLSEKDATDVINTMSSYNDFFVELMMLQELKLLAPDCSPLANAVSSFGSYLFYGFLPIAAYVSRLLILGKLSDSPTWAFFGHPMLIAGATAILASITLFYTNCKILPNQNRPSTHLLLFATLCLAAVCAYFLVWILREKVSTQFSASI